MDDSKCGCRFILPLSLLFSRQRLSLTKFSLEQFSVDQAHFSNFHKGLNMTYLHQKQRNCTASSEKLVKRGGEGMSKRCNHLAYVLKHSHGINPPILSKPNHRFFVAFLTVNSTSSSNFPGQIIFTHSSKSGFQHLKGY